MLTSLLQHAQSNYTEVEDEANNLNKIWMVFEKSQAMHYCTQWIKEERPKRVGRDHPKRLKGARPLTLLR
jgi:hypothetical protein